MSVASPSDYSVMVEQAEGQVIRVTDNLIISRPPENEPEKDHHDKYRTNDGLKVRVSYSKLVVMKSRYNKTHKMSIFSW